MDPIEFAEREYRRIMPTPETGYLEFPVGRIKVWLKDRVLPIAEPYSKRPAFREQASWPLRGLVPGAETAERRAVEAVDAALVTSARCLRTLAAYRSVARGLDALDRPTYRRTRAVTLRAGAGPDVQVTGKEPAPSRRLVLAEQVREIADRCWTDLVSMEDYFSPHRGLNFKDGEDRAQDGEFVVGFNPELHTVGDFVTRALLRRIEVWRSRLEDYRRICLEALSTVARKYPTPVEDEARAWALLETRVTELGAKCTGETAGLRDSCIVLTQVYAAFHPAPELSWLGVFPRFVAEASLLRNRILSQRDTETVERIARALGDLRALYSPDAPQVSAVDEAVAKGGLVLTKQPRSAYWETVRIPADWDRHPRAWDLLWALSVKAPLKMSVQLSDVYGTDVVSDSALSTLVGRLKEMLPASLKKHIVPTRRRSYRLELQLGCIHRF